MLIPKYPTLTKLDVSWSTPDSLINYTSSESVPHVGSMRGYEEDYEKDLGGRGRMKKSGALGQEQRYVHAIANSKDGMGVWV